MSVDISKIKPGDEVTVRLYARQAENDGSLSVSFEPGQYSVLNIKGSRIVSHTPKALEVGDRVKLRGGGCGFIRAIVGERAWVDLVDDPGEYLNGCAYGISCLERVDA